MKWLTTSAILCLLAMPATSAELDEILRLPTALYCGEKSPSHEARILAQYGELPFLEGDGEVLSPDETMSYNGKLKMYLDPEDMSYSIFLELKDQITCLVTTGIKLVPVKNGDGI